MQPVRILGTLWTAALLMACGHSLELGDLTPVGTELPEFAGVKGERHRMTEINVQPPIPLDSIHTAWLSADGEIQIFNHRQGKEIGRFDGKMEITNVAYRDGVFFWIEEEGKNNLVRLNAITGKEEWRIPGFPAAVNPLLWKKLCLFFGANGKILAVNRETGETVWEKQLGGGVFQNPLVTEDGVLIPGDRGMLYLVDPTDGEIRWRHKIPSPVLIMDLHMGRIYLGTHDGRMIAFNPGTQTVLWEVRTDYPVRDIPLVNGGDVYWTNTAGQLFKIREQSGEAEFFYPFRTPLESPPVQCRNGLLFAGSNGVLSLLDTENGTVTTTLEFDGRLRSVPLYYSGKWYIIVEDHWIYEMD